MAKAIGWRRREVAPVHVIAFGDLARKARREQGLSQRQLAMKVGCTISTVCHLETCKHIPNIIHVFTFAKVLGLDLNAFVREHVK